MTSRCTIYHAARILHAGGVIAYPTEGVYGIGCLPDNEAAIERIFQIKGRRADAGLILIAADHGLLTGWIAPTETEVDRLLRPVDKPTTWIVTAHPSVSPLLTGGRPTIAVRVTDHPVAGALTLATGSPLVSTSANRSGKPVAMSGLHARLKLGRQLDRIVHGPLGNRTGPSEIRVAQSDAVIRAGS
ncbi:MAG: L-threonylcarbamoyladenylate synthase [Gammaproteobacteria bacterium]|nr:L-threonylcarbamoyladenylate synthase [Gammaproteobacteria bacterium]